MLHLDLDAFFAAVEQRDKPSLRGKPVVVGGIGPRGVVATASYEARVFGVRSAMPTHEARRRCPQAAFLGGRFDAYREASRRVMGLLRTLSPLVEPLSLDEAFVDLRTATRPVGFGVTELTELVEELKADLTRVTDGLHASVGVASSKFVAKIATELDKPDGLCVIEPGTEAARIGPLPVGVIPGVGPVTQERLRRIGVASVADLRQAAIGELVQTLGRSQAQGLVELAHGRDDRAVEPEREAKSISVEDTFERDLTDRGHLTVVLHRDAHQIADRLSAARLFARTVSIKVRRHDFTTLTRSRTLAEATDRADTIFDVAAALLQTVDVSDGLRLLGVGVAGLTELLQEDLFCGTHEGGAAVAGDSGDVEAGRAGPEAALGGDEVAVGSPPADPPTRAWPPEPTSFTPGLDVVHDRYGGGWVWGSGLGRVTVRFEDRDSGPGPVRTFRTDDPALHRSAR